MGDDHDHRPGAAGGHRRALTLVRGNAAGASLEGPAATPFPSLPRGWFERPRFHENPRVQERLQERATLRELQGVLNLKKDACDHYRCSLFEKVQSHFGPVAAEHLKTRLGFAPCKQVIAWHRRADYMLSYPELLDPVPLAVTYITPALLLKHAFGPAIEKPAVLVRFRRSRDREDDARTIRECAPWFWDLPEPDLAFSTLRLDGWLLFACEEDHQAWLLVRTTESSIYASKRLVVREIVPATIARQREPDIAHDYLRPFSGREFDKCLW